MRLENVAVSLHSADGAEDSWAQAVIRYVGTVLKIETIEGTTEVFTGVDRVSKRAGVYRFISYDDAILDEQGRTYHHFEARSQDGSCLPCQGAK